MKGISPLIASVLIVAIGISAVSIVVTIGIPAIQKGREAGIINEAYQNINAINNLVKEVASEGVGSLRVTQLSVTEGTYRVNPGAGTFEYRIGLLSDILSRGTITREGNVETVISGGAASASENSTNIILENEILEVVFQKVGSESSFNTINTSTNIKTIRMKETGVTIRPVDSSVLVGTLANSSWGIGYSKAVFQGSNLPRAEALFHVRSNATGSEYEVVYTLDASTDFLLISFRNATNNLTTVNFAYKIGSNANEIIKIGPNETAFGAPHYPINQSYSLYNPNYTKNSSTLTFQIGTGLVFYNASNGEWRNISELYGIGQGNWSYWHDSTYTTINFSLAGSNGYDYGIRDAMVGGSYWLDENGRSLDSGLVGYWKFGEGGGTFTADSSGNGNSGSMGSVSFVTNSSCKYGNCGGFNGTASVSISDSNSLTINKSSLLAWINTRSTDLDRVIVSSYDTSTPYYGMSVNSGNLYISMRDGSGNTVDFNTNVSVNDGNWHLVGWTRDYDYVTAYIDGKIVGKTSASSIGQINPGSGLSIGRCVGACSYFTGMIDDVRLYSRSLSQNEVARIHESSSIKIRNDFLTANIQPFSIFNITNYTGGTVFSQATESIQLDTTPVTSNYTPNSTVYFFDWKENDWKIWQRNDYADALVGWWKFDEGNGVITTDSGKGNDGSVIGATWMTNTSCAIGSCLSFDGSDDYVQITTISPGIDHSTESNKSYTLQAWVRPRAVTTGAAIFSNSAGHLLQIGGSSNWQFNDCFSSNFKATINKQVHIVGVYDAIENKCYLYGNGELIISKTYSSSKVDIESLIIGKRASDNVHFNGMIDEPKLWNRALSAEEVKAEYHNMKRGAPDWLDPRFKQEFKWKQEFKAVGMPDINITYLMTAHDPFIRTFIDTGPVGYASYVDNSTAGYWQFNEGSGTSTADETGKGNTGTLTNGPTWFTNSSCKIGNCLFFDGVDDMVNISNNPSLNFGTESFTISTWFKTGQAATQHIFNKGDININGYFLRIDSTGRVTASIWSGANSVGATTPADTTYNDNTWHHAAGVWNRNGNLEVYVDGILRTSTSLTSFTYSVNNGTIAMIGARNSSGTITSFFNGNLDDIKMWNRELSPQEISQEYQRGITHNISIPTKLETPTSKTMHFDSGNQFYQSSVGGDWYIHIFNSSGWYGQNNDGSFQFLGFTNLEKTLIAFTNNIQNEQVAWYTTLWKAGDGEHKDYELSWANSSLTKYGRITSTYKFNSTNNNNFMFSLGYSLQVDTSSWTGGTGCRAYCLSQSGFSTESIESIGNSTLTHYNLKEDSLVGWWKFDHSNTYTPDSSGYNNTGRITGNVSWTQNGKFGGGMVFNATTPAANNNQIEIVDSPSLNPKTITVTMWIKPNNTGAGGSGNGAIRLFDKREAGVWTNGGYAAFVRNYTQSNGEIQFSVATDGGGSYTVGAAGAIQIPNVWYHVALTYDGLTSRVYVNGTELSTTIAESQKPGWIKSVNKPLKIGVRADDIEPFNGTMDNIKIYSRALSANEIMADYLLTSDDYPNYGSLSQTDGATNIFAQSFSYDGSAAAIWKLDEGSGSNTTDGSGNGNVGSIYNATRITNSSCYRTSCLNFNGFDSKVSISDSNLAITGDITIMAWVNPRDFSSGAYHAIMSKRTWGGAAAWGMMVNGNSDTLYWYSHNGAGSESLLQLGPDAINTGKWSHLAMVVRGQTVTGYLNGARIGSNTILYRATTSSKTTIGQSTDQNNNEPFDGLIDDVRVYSRAMSEVEIRDYYVGSSLYHDDFGTNIDRNAKVVGVEDSGTILQPIAPNVTVLHLRFNDNSTVNVTDSSRYGNTGRVVDTTNYTWMANSTCISGFGGCVHLDGANDYIEIKDNPSLDLGTQTIAAWFKLDGGGGIRSIMAKSNNAACGTAGPALFVLSNDVADYEAAIGGGCVGAAGATNVNDGKWHHVVGTHDGSTMRLYVDGVLDGQTPAVGTIQNTNDNLWIGANHQGGPVIRFFPGKIDEVMVINRSLTADEVYQLYIGGYNRTINGKTHRVASADGTSSISFNLTQKNNTLDGQDYDMRMLFINASQKTVDIPKPLPRCFDRNELTNLYVCTYDNGTDTSQNLAAGLVYAGSSQTFDKACSDGYLDEPKINISATGNSRIVLPFTKGTCSTIGNKTDIIARQGIPSTPFASFDIRGGLNFLLSLVYDRIKIVGSGSFGPGIHRLCIEKAGESSGLSLVNITAC